MFWRCTPEGDGRTEECCPKFSRLKQLAKDPWDGLWEVKQAVTDAMARELSR